MRCRRAATEAGAGAGAGAGADRKAVAAAGITSRTVQWMSAEWEDGSVALQPGQLVATANRMDIFVYYALVITKFAATKITGAHSFERSSHTGTRRHPHTHTHTRSGTTAELCKSVNYAAATLTPSPLPDCVMQVQASEKIITFCSGERETERERYSEGEREERGYLFRGQLSQCIS